MPMGCAPGAHRWVADGRFYSWVVCAHCGAPSICKACEGERGHEVGDLPDVFCPPHTYLADGYRAVALTGPLLGRRVVRLCSTARDYLEGWVSCEEGWRLRLVVGAVEVWLHRGVRRDWWRVVLLHAGRLVYHAEGPGMALVVRSLVPGRWVTEVQHAETWLDGQVQV
ncbi:MAG: hypothetical protein H0X24_04805 [Ktedonobacterales bacterium]|nr:hypothetical protein [Ktedonobacterales bacterium]